MKFEFATATRVIFGSGCISTLGNLVRDFGKRVLLVGGAGTERIGLAHDLITRFGLQAFIFQVTGEPTLDIVRAGADLARQLNCDAVIAIGGGSSIDTGKAIEIVRSYPKGIDSNGQIND